MARILSGDLRERIVHLVESGYSCREAGRRLQVSASASIKLIRHVKRSGSLKALKRGRAPGSGKLFPFKDYLLAHVRQYPDITMPELAAWLHAHHGISAAPATLSRFLCRCGLSYKKNSDGSGTRTFPCEESTSGLDLHTPSPS